MNGIVTPDDIPDRFAAAWNKRDASALAGMFSDDADFVNVVGLWWHNRADIERAHDYGLRTVFKDSELSSRRVEVRRLRDDVAVIHVRWRLSGQLDESGKALGTRSTVMIFVAQREETGWMVVAAQNTDVVPGMETLAATEGGFEAVDYRE